MSNKPIEDLRRGRDTMVSFHGLAELLLTDVSCNCEKTNGNSVCNSDFIRRVNARVGPRGSFKRSFSTARHKIGDQLAFLFARDEPSHYGFTTPLRGNNIGFIKFSSSALRVSVIRRVAHAIRK